MPFPLLVHGPMDFIPVLLAGVISEDHSIIVFTRAINTLIAGVTWIVFFDILLTSLRQNEYRFAAGVVSILMFAGMIAIIPADAVERQQAFLAIRDLFLVSTLWCTLRGLLSQSPLRRYALMVIGGVTAAASLFWAYDRFLATLAFSGALVLVLLIQQAWKPVAALIVGAAVGLLCIPYLVPTGSVAENVGNLAYWLRFASEVWHIPYLVRVPSAPTAVAMIMLLLIFAKIWYDANLQRTNDPALAFFAGIIALQAFFLLKYLNLPGQPNNYYFVWPFILLVAGLTLNWPAWRQIDDGLRNLWAAIRACGLRQNLGLVTITLSFTVIITNNMAFASFMNLRALISPPADEDLLPHAVRAAIRDLPLPKDGCVLLWSNEGVFATGLRRPICTSYFYPVYASASREAELLQQITSAPPAVVIFDSPFWSMNIYGRTMQQRLPAIDQYLRSHYRFKSRYGYLVGIRRSQEFKSWPVPGTHHHQSDDQ